MRPARKTIDFRFQSGRRPGRRIGRGGEGPAVFADARAENFLYGRPDLDDTIKRLQAFSAAGADVLYAPGLPGLDAIRTVCASVDKPVNVVMGLKGKPFSVEELQEAGVKRISVGGSFARGGPRRFCAGRAQEVKENGTFTYARLRGSGCRNRGLYGRDQKNLNRMYSAPEHIDVTKSGNIVKGVAVGRIVTQLY